jgi:hypothetical protein
MATLVQLAQIGEDSRLLSIFKVGIKRAVYLMLINPASTEQQIAWAKRARFSFDDVRVDFYATLILEGALVEDATFRNECVAEMNQSGSGNLPDASFIAIVNTWVTRFVARDI